jgi:3-oxoacyl-[acyl-carrier protein] reductase
MKKFDAFKIGDQASIVHVVTEKDIEAFTKLSGDDNRLHTDPEFASRTYLKKPVAHGMLGASFVSTIIGTKLPGDGALWFSQTFEFLKPVRLGDEITIQATVIKKYERDQILELETNIFNQDKQKCTTGFAKVKVVDVAPPAIVNTADESTKTVLVTGATGGIGTATCLELAKKGFDILINYNSNKSQALDLQNKIKEFGRKAFIFQANIADETKLAELEELIARNEIVLAGLVHCATPRLSSLGVLDVSYADIQKQIDTNLKGFINLVKLVAPIFINRKYGKVVVLSTQAVDRPVANMAHYIASKSALVGFAKSMAIELGPKGIRTNIVSPGMTDTDLIADMSLKARLIVEASSPLRRLAQPQEVAAGIAFLVSKDSDYINGETIRINGGQVII